MVFRNTKIYIDHINSFLILSSEFDNNFIIKNYEVCESILEKINKKYGKSLWLMKKTIVLLQNSKGLEAQKKYAQSIKDADFPLDLIPFITHYVSHRTEPTTHPLKFIDFINRELNNLSIPHGLISYLKYHIIIDNLNSDLDYRDILRYEFNSSIIDYYETFISVVQFSILKQDIDTVLPAITVCNEIDSFVNDTRIKAILRFSDKKQINTKKHKEVENRSFRNSLESSLNLSYEEFYPKIVEEPLNVGLIYLFLLSSNEKWITKAENSEENLPDYIIPLLRIFNKNSLDSEWVELARLSWAISGNILSYFLMTILHKEYDCLPLASDACGPYYFTPFIFNLNPVFLLWLEGDENNIYQSNLYCDDINSIDILDSSIIFKEKGNLTKYEEFVLWKKLSKMMFNYEYYEAIKTSEILFKSASPFFKRNSIRVKLYSLLNLKEYYKCIELIIKYHINQGFGICIMPIKDLFEKISKTKMGELAGKIEYVILCSLYVENFNPSSTYIISDACEDFLIAHDIQRPSQIYDLKNHFDNDTLVYFLSQVCREQTMDTWMEFNSSQEVSNERVEICKLIVNLDKSMKDISQTEIKEIIQKLKIKERLREIDQSKIYVDVESVKKVSQTALKDDFARYIAFLTSGMTEDDIVIRKKTADIIANNDVEALFNLNFPKHEMSALFNKMVITLRDEFVSSNQHGLEGYLSVRIRHNTLTGQLWNPLESENLLVYKYNEGKDYKPNDYWINLLNLEEGTDDYEIINNALIHLTKKYEEIINVIKQKWIHVRKDNNTDGLIDFRLTEIELGYLSTFITKDTSIDSFIDSINDYFFSAKLDPGLSTIRENLQTIIKRSVYDLLTEVQTKCELVSVDISKLRAAIGRARTNSQVIIDRIKEWFRLSSIEKREPFSVEEVVSISDASIKTVCPDFRSKYIPSEGMLNFVVQGKLTSFVDLLFIAFDNIVQHSGIFLNPTGAVYASYDNNSIKVRIENEVSDIVSSQRNKDHVKNMRTKVINNPFSKSVMKEGGTGFFKMQKILHHDFTSPSSDIKPTLDFGFFDNSMFFVEIVIPILSIQSIERK